jgi:uncharacterized membrane protein
MNNSQIYQEKLTSNRTEALFFALTLLFGGLFTWRIIDIRMDTLAVILLCFGILFLFYTVNYRTLVIQINPQLLWLRFGVISWREQISNIESCAIDSVPWPLRYGGAGIHFMTVGNRYRASFNFLEYSRVVIRLKQKRGPVHDLSFSTRHPEDVILSLR